MCLDLVSLQQFGDIRCGQTALSDEDCKPAKLHWWHAIRAECPQPFKGPCIGVDATYPLSYGMLLSWRQEQTGQMSHVLSSHSLLTAQWPSKWKVCETRNTWYFQDLLNNYSNLIIYKAHHLVRHWGSGDSTVVRASDSWSKGPGFESQQERQENILLQGQHFVQTFISVSVVPHPCYRSSKRSRSSCRRCIRQVTAKHTYIPPRWL